MSATMYSAEERERRLALLKCHNVCSRCGSTAWSVSLEAMMQLRPKRSNPSVKELVCGECCRKQDAKAIDPSKMSGRMTRRVRKERKTIRRQRGKAT